MTTVKLSTGAEYTVGKIVCVGQNYQMHIDELKSKKSKKPVLFLKPSTSILHPGELIQLPEFSKEVHHEVELAFLIGKTAKKIEREHWREYVIGAGIALDLTLRDIQREAKQNGHPWTVSKGFDGACPLSYFVPLAEVPDVQNLRIDLFVNDKRRQEGYTRDMIWAVDELIAYISGIFTLEPGDIVLTGTPAGVSELKSGDRLYAEISHVGTVQFDVA